MKILWLITARSGSKSIPDKNIKLLGGEPLLNYRIKTALSLGINSEVWISTDSEVYAKIAEKTGAKVPFIRPKNLAEDSTSSTDVVLHAMEYANNNGFSFNYIGLLEPTSPFIRRDYLINALEQLDRTLEATSIVAVKVQRPNTVFVQDDDKYLSEIANNLSKLKYLGRQEFRKQITPSGGFYISKWLDFMNNKSFYTSKTLSFMVDEISGLEIDEKIDWDFAEFLIEKKIVKQY